MTTFLSTAIYQYKCSQSPGRMVHHMFILTVFGISLIFSIVNGFTSNPALLRFVPKTSSSETLSLSEGKVASSMDENNNDSIDDNINIVTSEDELMILHQRIRQQDLQWYEEYVLDILGDKKYCNGRWPEIEENESLFNLPPKKTKQEEDQIAKISVPERQIKNQRQQVWSTSALLSSLETSEYTKASHESSQSIAPASSSSIMLEDEDDSKSSNNDNTSDDNNGKKSSDEQLKVPQEENKKDKVGEEKNDLLQEENEIIAEPLENQTMNLCDDDKDKNDDDNDNDNDNNGHNYEDDVIERDNDDDVGRNDNNDTNDITDKDKNEQELNTFDHTKVSEPSEAYNLTNDDRNRSLSNTTRRMNNGDSNSTVKNSNNNNNNGSSGKREFHQKKKEVVFGDSENEIEKVNSISNNSAVIYRNITGNTMTYVPLANLIEMGYTVPEIKRIQSEILSIIVSDKRKKPKLGGVPVQWKISLLDVPPEITIVDSIREASEIVNQMNDKERNERASKAGRRRRQEYRGGNNGERKNNSDTGKISDWRSDVRHLDRGGWQKSRTINTNSNNSNESSRNNRSVKTNTGNRQERKKDRRNQRNRRKNQEQFDNDDYPKGRGRKRNGRNIEERSIYSIPRRLFKELLKWELRDDPPENKFWMDINTFRDLLRKEANFRMQFLGDDWVPTIKQENNFRTETYKNWLWALNEGIGDPDAIIPPSRYERGRRNNRRNNGRRLPRKEEQRGRSQQRQRRNRPQRKVQEEEEEENLQQRRGSRQRRRSQSSRSPPEQDVDEAQRISRSQSRRNQ